jgi:hypothetical protein
MITLKKHVLMTYVKALEMFGEFSKNNSFSVSHRTTFQEQSFSPYNWQMLLCQKKMFVLLHFSDKNKYNSTEKVVLECTMSVEPNVLAENLKGWGFDVLARLILIFSFWQKDNSTRL